MKLSFLHILPYILARCYTQQIDFEIIYSLFYYHLPLIYQQKPIY